MLLQRLKKELSNLDKRWNKLIFLCETKEPSFDGELYKNIQYLNVNLIVSEQLMHVPVNRYALEIEEIIRKSIQSKDNIFFLHHIDILFSPDLKINPVRLFESISKQNKIIVNWPGLYRDRMLYYAEPGHPEYFYCDDFKGIVIER